MSSPAYCCRLCGDVLAPVFRKVLLERHDVQYFQCTVCQAMQTEPPYWLAEAYLPINERFDTGQVTRSTLNAAFLSWLVTAIESPSIRILDYGCGSGFLVRLLRDVALDAWGLDSYSEPRLSSGFQVDDPSGFDLINLCEVVEHFDKPSQILDSIFASNPSIVVVQTAIMGDPDPAWPYLGDFHGQHIFFITVETVYYLAKRYKRHVRMVSGYLLFITDIVAVKLLDPVTGDFVNGLPDLNSEAVRLVQAMLANPYRYPLVDLAGSMKSIGR